MNVPGTTVTLPRGRVGALISHVAFNFRPPAYFSVQRILRLKIKFCKKEKILSKSFLSSIQQIYKFARNEDKGRWIKNKSLRFVYRFAYFVIVTYGWHRFRDTIPRIRIGTTHLHLSLESVTFEIRARIEEEEEEKNVFARFSLGPPLPTDGTIQRRRRCDQLYLSRNCAKR